MIKVLAIILFALMGIIGEERGVMSFFTLICNVAVFIMATYMMAKGKSPMVVVFICCCILCAITLFYQNGINKKTWAAFLAVQIVVILMSASAWVVGNKSIIGGYNDISIFEDDAMFLDENIDVDMEHVEIAIIIMGLLGSIMDTAIAIATAVYEVYRHNEDLTEKGLFKSGIIMGKDILGTTSNTLVLAGIGESILLFNRYKRFNYSFLDMINSEAFFQEFVFIIFGAIGCVLIIPITAFLICKILKKEKKIKLSV